MPLKESGKDAEYFDTFDVAKMTDHRDKHPHPNNWSSRQTGGGGTTAAANSRYTKNGVLSPTPELDDFTSLDSSSGRMSEETDRVGSRIMGMRGISTASNQSSGGSVGSLSSYHTHSVSLSGNSDNLYPSHTPYNSHMSMYETSDNLDEIQHDLRNPSEKRHGTLRTSWGGHIPEEEETSLSTMEDSSVSLNVHQQSIQCHHCQNTRSRPNSHQMHQPPRPRSQRHRRKQPHVSEADDVSVASHQSQHPDLKKECLNNDKSSLIIQQLESQVAKLNFELATTKSSLDEIQLENRRLGDERNKLSTNLKLLQEENEQLHLKIERLEKEKILRNMEGTKGVARSTSDDWAGNGARSVASSDQVFTVSTQRLGKVGGVGSLEVPFRTQGNDYHLHAGEQSSSSLASVLSFNELSGDEASREDKDCVSTNSVPLSDSNADLGERLTDNVEQDKMVQIPGMNVMNIIGGRTRRMRETTKKRENTSNPSPSHRTSDSKKEADSDTPTKSILSKPGRLDVYEAGSNVIRTNPQGEEFNDDDPFATWSAKGDPKRKEPEQNWSQRGLRESGDSGKGSQNSRQALQSNEFVEDPFDSCNGGRTKSDEFAWADDTDKYVSFCDNTDYDERDSNAGDTALGMQDRKGFGLFKGLMGGGRR